MALLLVSEAKELVHSTMSDVSLTLLIDRIEDEITDMIGAPYSSGVTITEEAHGMGNELFLKRPFSSITSVTDYFSIGTPTTVTSTQYQGYGRQGRLRRLAGHWGLYTSVVYTPVDQNAQRKGCIIDLLRLYIARTPLLSESVGGEFSYTAPPNWEVERNRILSRIAFLDV